MKVHPENGWFIHFFSTNRFYLICCLLANQLSKHHLNIADYWIINGFLTFFQDEKT